MDAKRIKDLTLSINKGGVYGLNAVKNAYEQYEEMETLKEKKRLTPDEYDLIYQFVLALNEGAAAVFSSHVYWAEEQLRELNRLQKESSNNQ